MWHLFSGGKPWFKPKRFGYGAGLPIAWEGWALLASYIAGIVGLSRLAPGARGFELAAVLIAMFLLTCVLVMIVRARTEGEWRWRWGDD